MSELSTTVVVDAYRYTGDDFDLSGNALWAIALAQRAFGPAQLLVVTTRGDGTMVGLAHCPRTEPPYLALQCCLDTLDDGAVAAVAYSDEPVSADPPIGLRHRLDTARSAAREFGVHLVDWVMCDDTQMRSTLEENDDWWDPSDAGLLSATLPPPVDRRNRSPRQPRRSPRERGRR